MIGLRPYGNCRAGWGVAGVRENQCRSSGVCVVAFLPPLRGLLISCFATQGLRRGLHSVAASRLDFGLSYNGSPEN
jgi:hypothetical protein